MSERHAHAHGDVAPSLPQNEPDPDRRAAVLEVRRDTYRHVYDWPKGVATGSYVPDGDGYSKEYSAKSVPIYAKIGGNYAEMAVTAGPKGLLHRIGEAIDGARHAIKNRIEGHDSQQLSRSMLSSFRDEAREKHSQERPESWHDYTRIFGTFETPAVVKLVDDRVTLDRAMAWQRVGGVNPMVLRRCDRVPDNLAVTPALFASVVEGDSLEGARAEGRLYIADYAALDGVLCGVTDGLQKYLAAPIALYVVDREEGYLRTVCIQTGQTPDAAVFTPRDGEWHWRMANQCLQVADANHHEGVAHLGRTHMVMEAVLLSLKRQLAPHHPLAILLEPHTETTGAINYSAKTSLIAPGGTVDVTFAAKISVFGDLVRDAVQTLSIKDANPHADLHARGLHDREALPQHPYRDDVTDVWAVLRAYVGRYVALYYTSDADVQADVELAGFARELGADDGGRLRDVPQPQTVEALVDLVSTILFIATAQHSAVNFAQYPYMGYVPNMAGSLYTAAPTRETPDTEAAFQAMLPPWKIAVESVTMVYLLSSVRDTTLGQYRPGTFTDDRVAAVVGAFESMLAELDETIAVRDADRFLSYPFLRPSQILQSISI